MDTNPTEVNIEQANRYEGSTDDLVQQANDRGFLQGIRITSGEDIDPSIWTPEKIEKLKAALRHIRDSEQRIKGSQG
ncbi:hypothetical protein RAY_259 [Erwinia phage vB_EamM_RAY]|uniref:Uncharacterized protein n=4 Tax=Agricanvirus TaxID=1984776 RepID=A0A173GF42_9CAUD|nr:hypothetical protein FDH98_gp259 [Erwinia phage vB_EamM_RAY]YP_009622002.1 hypothetical protein FDJ23_gp261 [Erwinia phage vB_EamM_Desertfox]AUG87014.1 hypothetical protein MORTIMER_266 [Erwinia phage vB_EamM_Mortimer]QBP07366.1 hypothetical protein REBECCA_261 [Erwinia phage Rebecca]ANH52039.1 hypothetical protein RAY_259 [Erwinia phage vB_EamM_RAY]AUG86368.1 hypothetical protein DESERTFOX_261 [Erwinia phage vB_EamM_Desertfox]